MSEGDVPDVVIPKKITWLHSHLFIPQKDVRRLLLSWLNASDMEMVACAHNSHRVPVVSERFLSVCARNGYWSLLRWSHGSLLIGDSGHATVKTHFTDRVCSSAARGGHLEVLQWLRSIGCPWDSYTCSSAANGGHLDVLTWARENGCPWNASTLCRAHHFELFKWAMVHECPRSEQAYYMAAQKGYLDILKWVDLSGPRGNAASVWAAKGGQIEVLKWGCDNGWEVDAKRRRLWLQEMVTLTF